MKYVLLVCLAMSLNCFGSYVNEVSAELATIHDSCHIQADLFNQYKKAFAAYFCQKALAQQRDDVASRCGKYGFGQDWRNEMEKVSVPVISGQHSEIVCDIARDMVESLSDVADWLKQNAH